MDHFAGLDVSVKETSVCIVDDTGKLVREVKVSSEPEALLAVLKTPAYHFKRIGLEAGPLSQWLFSALAEAGLPVICVETRHMKAVLKAQINKTDRNDARGIAQIPPGATENALSATTRPLSALWFTNNQMLGTCRRGRIKRRYSHPRLHANLLLDHRAGPRGSDEIQNATNWRCIGCGKSTWGVAYCGALLCLTPSTR